MVTAVVLEITISHKIHSNFIRKCYPRKIHNSSYSRRSPWSSFSNLTRTPTLILSSGLYIFNYIIWVCISWPFLLRPLYFDLCTSTFCQIWISYWSRSMGRSTVLVEEKFDQKHSDASNYDKSKNSKIKIKSVHRRSFLFEKKKKKRENS